MKMKHAIVPFVSFLILAVCPACHRNDSAALIPPAGKYDVRILRDEWGVPHLFGKTDADVAYGLGYVQCEDDWGNVEGAILTARGRLASLRGQAEAKSDYLVQLFRVREFVDEKYEKDLSPATRAVVEAYAAGVTHFAALHPDKLPHVELPVTGKDIVARTTFISPFFYELQRDLDQWFNGPVTPPDAAKKTSSLTPGTPLAGDASVPWTAAQMIGSNTFAVSPSRSADGATRLAVNSHMPWEGPVAYYEAHLHSEEGWDMVGCTVPGGPLVCMGHDTNKGWCHTINKPDLADIYALEVNPDNPNQYKFDGAWRDLERGTARMNVRLWRSFSWTFKREMLWSVHGPVIRRPEGLFAIRFAGYGEIRHLEQWYQMNKACNLEEFKRAMALLALPSLNTLYADKSGNTYYIYYGTIPLRDEAYDWTKPVPGNTSATLWTGFWPLEKLPQVLNPASGVLQSCNSTPFHASVGADNPDPGAFPKSMGVEQHETNRSRRAQELYGGDSSITREEFYAYKFDKTYSTQSDVGYILDKLFTAEAPQEPLLQEGIALLRGWNRSVHKESTAAALGILVGYPHSRRDLWAGKPFNAMNALREAAGFLKAHYGRLDVPLQQVLRLRHGQKDLGLAGGPDCLRAVYFEVNDDGHLVGVGGDCYLQMVEWDRQGQLRSEAVSQYGSATGDATSPHYADQAPLFAEEKLRPVLMREAEVRQHLKREYRPGDFAGPWHVQ